jgi:hypothetical protein
MQCPGSASAVIMEVAFEFGILDVLKLIASQKRNATDAKQPRK